MTRQQAINAKCRNCIFDDLANGTWRMQTEACELTGCALHPYRPKSRSNVPSKSHSAAVQPHYGPIRQEVMA
jgi:hypothetical protein